MKISYRADQLKTFWYWINERHRIYIKRSEHHPGPWTRDLILQKYKFTNAFRQLDRVTQAWTDRYAGLLGGKREDTGLLEDVDYADILYHVVLFRLFNWPATYDALHYAGRWNYERSMKILEQRKAEGQQIFTGAYIIPNMGSKLPKIEIIAGAVDLVYENRKEFAAYIRAMRSMEKTTEVLQLVPTIGPFIAYEIACDLRFTRVLSDALDINCWANAGPGAMRGIHRLMSGACARTSPRPDYVAVMKELLERAQEKLGEHVLKQKDCPFEMREIEHSLCEFDKYMRVKNGEGRPRGLFKPLPPPPWEDTPSKQVVAMRMPAAMQAYARRKKGRKHK